MKTKIFAWLMIAALAGVATGCIETEDGRTQAGVPFVKDKIEGRYERSVAQVLEAARAVLKFNGTLTADNSVNNSLTGRVNQSTVWVKVDEIDSAKPVSRVVVQARGTGGISDLDLAHEIEKQIALKLAAGS
jgi:hypothetical protein